MLTFIENLPREGCTSRGLYKSATEYYIIEEAIRYNGRREFHIWRACGKRKDYTLPYTLINVTYALEEALQLC